MPNILNEMFNSVCEGAQYIRGNQHIYKNLVEKLYTSWEVSIFRNISKNTVLYNVQCTYCTSVQLHLLYKVQYYMLWVSVLSPYIETIIFTCEKVGTL